MKISYLAGIIDGEGYIGIIKCSPQIKYRETKHRYKPVLIIVNTNRKLIDKLNDNFEGHIHQRKRIIKSKITYDFTFTQKGLWNILPKIIPYLIVKKEQAKLLIELRKTFRFTGRNNGYKENEINQKEEIYKNCKELNG